MQREKRLEAALKKIAAVIILAEDSGDEPDTTEILVIIAKALGPRVKVTNGEIAEVLKKRKLRLD